MRSAGSQGVRAGAEPPLGALARISADGRLDGCEIEYWTGGGLPPPLYRSEQFRFLTVDGHDTMEVARPRYDIHLPADAGPGYPVERARLEASVEDLRSVARKIIECELFTRHFPEEVSPGGADLLSTEVIVTVGGRTFQRRYFRRVPVTLDPLRVEVERLIREVGARGRRGIFHQGHPLALR